MSWLFKSKKSAITVERKPSMVQLITKDTRHSIYIRNDMSVKQYYGMQEIIRKAECGQDFDIYNAITQADLNGFHCRTAL